LRSQVDVLRGAITRTADLTHRLRVAVADSPAQAAPAVAGGAEPLESSAAHASAARPASVPFEPLPGPDRPAHVLVVEDDDAVRALAVRILSRAEYRVTSAASGREAFELIAGLDGEVDLVLSDLRMDDVSGPELDERIRRVWPTLRTLFMSGYPEDHRSTGPDAPGAAEGARPLRVIGKPFTVDELLREVEEALRGA
jgi:two-component system cell cycle sensor histidine kinase/response regulator CckA